MASMVDNFSHELSIPFQYNLNLLDELLLHTKCSCETMEMLNSLLIFRFSRSGIGRLYESADQR